MVLNKKIIQVEVEKTLENKKYTEGLGKVILLFADVSVNKRGIRYRFSEFEVDFIIKPRIVDMLLLKVFKYEKSSASAYTFFSLITSSAINRAIRDVRLAERGESKNIFYIEDVQKEMRTCFVDDEEFSTKGVYLDGDIIKLK